MQDSSCPQVLAAPPQVCTPAWAIHKAGAPPSLAAAPRETYEHEASGTARATAVPSLDQVYLVVNMCALQWRLAFSWRRVSVGHAGVAEAKKPPSSGCEERGPQSTKKTYGAQRFVVVCWIELGKGVTRVCLVVREAIGRNHLARGTNDFGGACARMVSKESTQSFLAIRQHLKTWLGLFPLRARRELCIGSCVSLLASQGSRSSLWLAR
jgi:hypothetical protein